MELRLERKRDTMAGLKLIQARGQEDFIFRNLTYGKLNYLFPQK